MTTHIGARILVAGAAAAALLTFEVPAKAQTEQANLMAIAREARSVTEHADLARRFRQQAEAFDVKAAERAAEATRLSRNAPSVAHKWAAMVPQSLDQAKRQAVDARRAAQESRTMADRHLRLAVETQGAGSQTAD